MKSSAPPIKCPQVFHPIVILIQRVKKQAFFKSFCFVTPKRQALVVILFPKTIYFFYVTLLPVFTLHLQNRVLATIIFRELELWVKFDHE